jgi:hypothetical protein
MTLSKQTLLRAAAAILLLAIVAKPSRAQIEAPKKLVWQQVAFAIVKFNDDAPKSWNIYHSEKKGVLLVRVWKRYLLVDTVEQEAYDIDPQKVNVKNDTVEWSFADLPEKPIDTPEWKERNVGNLVRVRFRLGKDGHFLELQMPLGPTGRPIY